MMAARRVAGPTLGELLAGLAEVPAGAAAPVVSLADDSRRVTPGALFFACARAPDRARAHLEAAARAGAGALVAARGQAFPAAFCGVPAIAVDDVRACLGAVADRFYGEPSRALAVIGVTGTNGKTSVSHYLAHAIASGGGACGVLGTLGHGLYESGGWEGSGWRELERAPLTTPDVLDMHRLLAAMRAGGARHASVELSSHALEQNRAAGVRVRVGVFTNLSRDHLDYHASFAEYARAKRRLFERPELGAAVVNVGDPAGRELAGRLPPAVDLVAFSLAGAGSSPRSEACSGAGGSPPGARARRLLEGRVLGVGARGVRLAVRAEGAELELAAPVPGRCYAANLLAALGALMALGLEADEAARRLADPPALPGRLERFGGGDAPLVVVDYAHTPEALERALEALREAVAGELWCVFGCGGERDRGKRPQMGAIAAALADRVVVTDDNPRREPGERIVADILAGIGGWQGGAAGRVVVERDRARAIARAVSAARAGDAVLVAGKGHEPYQDIGGSRRPFSDAAAVRAALALRRASRGGRS